MSKHLDKIMEKIRKDAKSKKMAKSIRKDIFKNINFTYASSSKKGCIDKVYKNGKRISGKRVNGRFIPTRSK